MADREQGLIDTERGYYKLSSMQMISDEGCCLPANEGSVVYPEGLQDNLNQKDESH